MIRTERFKGLEEKIGYTFTNKRTLALAMTHSSYANEQRGRRKANNERLEFLGDAVLEVTISDYVFREYPGYNEGRLTKLRSSLVCEYTLAICARDVELGKYLLLSRGEDATGGRERDSILSDAFEALIIKSLPLRPKSVVRHMLSVKERQKREQSRLPLIRRYCC